MFLASLVILLTVLHDAHTIRRNNDPKQFFLPRLWSKWGSALRQRSAAGGHCSACRLWTVIACMGCRARPACRNIASV